MSITEEKIKRILEHEHSRSLCFREMKNLLDQATKDTVEKVVDEVLGYFETMQLDQKVGSPTKIIVNKSFAKEDILKSLVESI